jgi:hypothetical protein
MEAAGCMAPWMNLVAWRAKVKEYVDSVPSRNKVLRSHTREWFVIIWSPYLYIRKTYFFYFHFFEEVMKIDKNGLQKHESVKH